MLTPLPLALLIVAAPPADAGVTEPEPIRLVEVTPRESDVGDPSELLGITKHVGSFRLSRPAGRVALHLTLHRQGEAVWTRTLGTYNLSRTIGGGSDRGEFALFIVRPDPRGNPVSGEAGGRSAEIMPRLKFGGLQSGVGSVPIPGRLGLDPTEFQTYMFGSPEFDDGTPRLPLLILMNPANDSLHGENSIEALFRENPGIELLVLSLEAGDGAAGGGA